MRNSLKKLICIVILLFYTMQIISFYQNSKLKVNASQIQPEVFFQYNSFRNLGKVGENLSATLFIKNALNTKYYEIVWENTGNINANMSSEIDYFERENKDYISSKIFFRGLNEVGTLIGLIKVYEYDIGDDKLLNRILLDTVNINCDIVDRDLLTISSLTYYHNYSNLTVGDRLMYDTYVSAIPQPDAAYLDFSVVEGSNIEIISEFGGEKGFKFNSEGEKIIEISLVKNNTIIDYIRFNLNIKSELQKETISNIKTDYKLGEEIDFKYILYNARYENYYLNPEENFYEKINNYFVESLSGGGGYRACSYDQRIVQFGYDFGAPSPCVACKIGSFNINIIDNRANEIYKIFTITIEPPEIVTNLPSYIIEGETYNFRTELSNLPIINFNDQPFNFIPIIEIIEGKELISILEENNTYINTSQKLKFIKDGKVKIKIKYELRWNNKYEITDFLDEEVGENFFSTSWFEKKYGVFSDSKIIEIDVINKIIKGDINDDGDINVIDLLLIKKAIMKKIQLTEVEKSVADTNNDGKINVIDALILLRLVLGKTNN